MPVDSPSAAALGLAVFPTARTALPSDAVPEWRLIGALAQAIPGTGDANAVEIADQLRRLPDLGLRPGPEDRLSRAFSTAVANDTAYHRALVDHALNGRRYWGYGDRFYVDARAAANDPGAFPDGVPQPEYWEQDSDVGNGVIPKDFVHFSGTTWENLYSILRGAKSPTVSVWLLDNLPKPSETDVRSLARFLDSPDPRLRHAFVKRLAFWYGESVPEEPREEKGPDGEYRWVYPGLDTLVAYWKARLKGG